jgi:transcriptional regulator with XRE-family HTH domain
LSKIDKKIGQKIKRLRKGWGFSQIELAEKIGVSFQQVQKYEKGFTTMSVFRLQQISEALGVSINTFFEEGTLKMSGPTIEYNSGRPPVKIFQPLSKDEIIFLRSFRKLTNNKLRQGFLKQLKEIVKMEKQGIGHSK